jgi:hypothetical protein
VRPPDERERRADRRPTTLKAKGGEESGGRGEPYGKCSSLTGKNNGRNEDRLVSIRCGGGG